MTATRVDSISAASERGSFGPNDLRLELIAWFVFLTVAFSGVTSGLIASLILLIGVLGWSFSWILRVIRFARGRIRERPHPLAGSVRFRSLAFEPIVLLISALYVESGVPRQMRFQISKPWLDRFAERVESGQIQFEFSGDERDATDGLRSWTAEPRIVGLYRARAAAWFDSGVIELTIDSGSFEDGFLIYAPDSDGNRVDLKGMYPGSEHAGGPWWFHREPD